LIAFVGWSAVRDTVGSINNYMSDIECDLPWVNRSNMPRLQRHLNGFEWIEKATKDGRLRLSGGSFFQALDLHLAMAQAVYSTAFGHFMRPAEISVRKTNKGIRTKSLVVVR
jgi:hypothetical protein